MSEIISSRVRSLSESASLKMSQRAMELRECGIDIVSLTVGEPDQATPSHIKSAIRSAVDNDFSHYAPVGGYGELRSAISDKLRIENGLDYSKDEVIVSVGAKQALCNTILSLVNSGDEVIIPTPCWVSYGEMVKLAEGTPIYIKTDAASGYKLSAAQLGSAITDRTKAIILCSPNNPTGSVYGMDELASLVEVLRDRPYIYIISDEIYEHINYVGLHHSIASFEEVRDRVIIVNGVSKSYAMTGYRIGWLASKSSLLVSSCKKLQGQYLTSACSVSQKGAEAAYRGSQDCVREMCAEFMRRRDLIMSLICEIPYIRCLKPDGAFYIFPDVSAYFGKKYNGKEICTSDDMTEYLLDVAHVAVVSGSAFGDDNCIRLSYATSERNIREGVCRIKSALQELL